MANTRSYCVAQTTVIDNMKINGLCSDIYKNRGQAHRPHFANRCSIARLSTQKEATRGSKHPQMYAAEYKH